MLLTVRCVQYWQGFSTIRTVRYWRFRATSPSEYRRLLRNRRRQVAKAVNCFPGYFFFLQIAMKLQLSVCDTIIQRRQDSTPYVFLQLNAFRHNAKRPDKITRDVRVFTIMFPDSAQGIDTKHYIYRSTWKR